jgi:hypothetical protein
MHKQYLEISRSYQYSRSKLKTCKQLDVFLITYLHWWCNIIKNNNYSNEQSNISYSLFIHNISSLEEKDWIQTFTITLYFNSLQYYPTLDKTLAIQLSLHLIYFIIRLYSCNINPNLVYLWFLFCIFLINVTVLWSVNTTNGWNVHQNASKITIRQVIFFNCGLFIWSLSNI